MPPSIRSTLADSLYTSEPWNAAAALHRIAEKKLVHDVRRLALEHRRAMAPADPEWLTARLTRMALAFGHDRDQRRATAWLIETTRLLMDLPADIIHAALDEAVKRQARGFMPAVGEVRAIADPMREDREREAARLEAIVRLLDRPREAPTESLPPPAGDRLDPADVGEANAIMRRVGARTRYRPDGSHYLLGKGDDDPARPEGEANRAA